ncbi:MAG: relaxase/mobilization nuclease domain-containing protein [Spirochaetales bacterium]|nr:relaxase/mobilization nuclease domain-containing protein [Spirochaetales bacterium]
MAVTKIHAIKFTLGKAIAYICNENKTDDRVLVSSFSCAPETADIEFRFALSKSGKPDDNKASHLIQSFAPGEVSGEEAHEIGQELANRFLQGKYSCVLATHVDRHHIHNHLVFCASDNIEHKKYKSTFKNYYKIRDTSDRICAEHGISVIRDFKEVGKTYNEWLHARKGDSWKAQIKKDIDECIKAAVSYDDFLKRMADKGYEINGASFGEGSAKYISFRPFGKDRFVRGRANSLGANYTKEKIRERIEERSGINTDKIVQKASVSSFSIQDYLRKYASEKPNTLIDRSKAEGKGVAYGKWMDKENFKRFTEIYAKLDDLGLQSEDALRSKITELHDQVRQEKLRVKDMEKELRTFNQILTFAQQYAETKKYNTAYDNSKDQDRYYRTHNYELTLYWSAGEHLQELGVDINTMKIKDIEEHIQKLTTDHHQLIASFRLKEKEHTKLSQMYKSFNDFLNEPSKEPPVKPQKSDHSI